MNLKLEKSGIWGPIMLGLMSVNKIDPSFLTHADRWKLVIKLVENVTIIPDPVFDSAISLIHEPSITPENFAECIDLLIKTISLLKETQEITSERSRKAIDKLYKLNFHIPALIKGSNFQSERAWYEFWLPALSGLGLQSYHTDPEIRTYAFGLFSKMILSTEFSTAIDSADHFRACFDNVLFPIIQGILSDNVDDTRAIQLMCKFYLSHMLMLKGGQIKSLVELWFEILSIISRYLSACTNQVTVTFHFIQIESIQESLKNMVLVMSADAILIPDTLDAEENNSGIWAPTWERVDLILPGLKGDLFPELNQNTDT